VLVPCKLAAPLPFLVKQAEVPWIAPDPRLNVKLPGPSRVSVLAPMLKIQYLAG